MVEKAHRPMTTYITEGDLYTSYEHLRQEYPTYGTSDYRYPALEVQGTDGSALCTPVVEMKDVLFFVNCNHGGFLLVK